MRGLKINRPRFAVAGAIVAVAGVVTAMMASGALSGGPDRDGSRLDTMSNRGHAVELSSLPASQLADLATAGIRPSEIRFLGLRSETGFYIATSDSGRRCFLTSRADAPRPEFSWIVCAGLGNAFPTANEPVLDLGAAVRTPGERLSHVKWLTGFAADGVAEVGIVDEDGVLHSTAVTDNIYASGGLADIPATAIVARDVNGKEVFRRSLEPYASPTQG